MKIVANETYIERREKAGEVIPMVAMGCLLGSVVLSVTQPEWFVLTMGLTLLGFLLSLAGSFFLDRFVGERAHHKTVPAALKGLDDRYTLIMYELPVPFVLVEPGGVSTILPKNHGGEITYEGGRWLHQQKARLLRQIGGQEALSRPERQVEGQVKKIESYLEERLPEDTEVPVRGLLLFTNPELHLEADDAPVPAIRAAKLKNWLRGPGRLTNLPSETRAQIKEALEITENDLEHEEEEND